MQPHNLGGKYMNRHVFLASIWVAASGFALAGEPQSTPQDWTGLYVGAHIGAVGSNLNGSYDDDGFTRHDFVKDGGGPFRLNSRGAIGGVQIGHNWQYSNFVYGIEGDISFGNWTDALDNAARGRTPESVSADAHYIATLRARAGYALDHTLVYGTLGAAITDTTFRANDDMTKQDPTKIGSVALDKIGAVVGGGVEYALNEGWSVKAEGLYFLFNDYRNSYDLTNDKDAGNFIQLNDTWSVKVGLNYRF
jgi:opacity protein-like surface antigen